MSLKASIICKINKGVVGLQLPLFKEVKMIRITETVSKCIEGRTLKKIVFSKSENRAIDRAVAKLVKIKDETMLQMEILFTAGGAKHVNVHLENAPSYIAQEFEKNYGQINIVDIGGIAEGKKSKSGKFAFINKIKKTEGSVGVLSQNREKEYVLSPNMKFDFLVELGIQDSNGRIHDKKQSKFRQINKFLEIIKDTLKYLPNDDIVIWDLCCGKSYLSFAVYYYFREILGKNIKIYGVDLKKDVIEYCSSVAEKLSFNGLVFFHGDINEVSLPAKPHMVMSLHACDIATDIVLNKAVFDKASVILSTPCCQHELAGKIKSDNISFITDYPILKQKLSSLITDALRCQGLKSCGYSVTCLEFIDPEETPKNMMIKAIKTSSGSEVEKENYLKLCEEYNATPHFKNVF